MSISASERTPCYRLHHRGPDPRRAKDPHRTGRVELPVFYGEHAEYRDGQAREQGDHGGLRVRLDPPPLRSGTRQDYAILEPAGWLARGVGVLGVGGHIMTVG